MHLPLLSVNGVTRAYPGRRRLFRQAEPVRAVDGVSLSVGPGQTLGIVGESGCGKSTTGRLALGLELPDQGEVRFQGAPMPLPGSPAWRRLRAQIQLVPQDPLGALDRRMTIGAQVVEPLAIHNRVGDIAALLYQVGLRPDQAARYQHPLSGVLEHPLGTDELGRDVLSRLIESIRISLLIAFGATALATLLGTTLGFLAAQSRGWVEQLVLVLVDFQAALPFLILALAVLAFFGNALPLFIGLMGLYGWERHERIARGLALSANAQGYAESVRQLGAGPFRVYLRHILPNIAATLIVSATLSFPEIVLLESGLSFLGLGIQPPMTSLGNMIGYGREYLTRAPWILLAPSTVVVLTTFSVSVLGDWLRDRLDPASGA